MKTPQTSSAISAQLSTVNKYVLVVVDMQVGFRASLSEATILAVEEEIIKAKAARMPIVVLEYAKYPATHARLLELLEGYDRFAVETKFDDDGSTDVIESCIGNEYFEGNYRICGVNTLWCVQGTAVGLADKLDESIVEVVKAACNDEDNEDCWQKFASRPNLRLV